MHEMGMVPYRVPAVEKQLWETPYHLRRQEQKLERTGTKGGGTEGATRAGSGGATSVWKGLVLLPGALPGNGDGIGWSAAR